jgi:hypothetical protein
MSYCNLDGSEMITRLLSSVLLPQEDARACITEKNVAAALEVAERKSLKFSSFVDLTNAFVINVRVIMTQLTNAAPDKRTQTKKSKHIKLAYLAFNMLKII